MWRNLSALSNNTKRKTNVTSNVPTLSKVPKCQFNIIECILMLKKCSANTVKGPI